MTLVGLLAFLGMAVVAMDVLGGIIAATFLARGMRPVHLLAFVGGYAVAVIVVTILLHPLLRLLGAWLAPVLGSETAISVIQILVGLALIAVGIHQHHRMGKPPVPRTRDVKDRAGSLLAGGALLAVTTFADPTFTIAVGMAGAVTNLPERIVLLVIWNVIYQLPLVVVTTTALLGKHEKVIDAVRRAIAPRRRAILRVVATVLILAGLVVITDGIVALAGTHRPWLDSLLLGRR